MENGLSNPFAKKNPETSLEKIFNNGPDGATDNGGDRREVIVRGVLSVTVISAEDLAPADLMGKADPYVVLTMKKTGSKNKTRVCVCSSVEYFEKLLTITSISFILFLESLLKFTVFYRICLIRYSVEILNADMTN